MQDIKKIRKEIRKIVTDTVDAGAIGHVQFFTAQIMAQHNEIHGDDADFYLICAREVIVSEVKKAIGKYDKPGEETLTLEGFEHLQSAYPVHRGGDHVLVPVHLCTDEELEERAAQYEKAARGSMKHAKEIRGFIETRRAERGEAAS